MGKLLIPPDEDKLFNREGWIYLRPLPKYALLGQNDQNFIIQARLHFMSTAKVPIGHLFRYLENMSS